METVALRVQGLPLSDQVLVLARLVESRSEERLFTVAGVDALLHDLSLPAPAKTSNILLALERQKLVRRGKNRGQWRVTPSGRERSETLVSGIDLVALESEAAVTGTRLGGAAHPVLVPEFAPPSLIGPLRRFLVDHPFDQNVLGMTRFPDDGARDPLDPVKTALEKAKTVCAAHHLEFHLASDRAIDDDLWTNVAAHMWASRYGIAFFEDLAKPKRGVNYNLTIEVGAMLMTGRRCALLKDSSIESLPTDLVGRIYKPVVLRDPTTVEKALHAWIRDDLDLGSCGDCG